jgi:hypothetical protein
VRVLVVFTAEEAIAAKCAIKAMVQISRDNKLDDNRAFDLVVAAGRRIGDAITRQTTPRSLVSHED